MSLEEEYLRARAIPSFRQSFLDGIDLAEYGQYISGVRYIQKGSFSEMRMKDCGGAANLSTNPLQMVLGLKGLKSPIWVDQRPFLFFENPYDFLGILLHHEGEHARQRFSEGRLGSERGDFFEALAWANQLRNIDRENCSPGYCQRVISEASSRLKYLEPVKNVS